jgi:hypothetical protein
MNPQPKTSLGIAYALRSDTYCGGTLSVSHTPFSERKKLQTLRPHARQH